MKYLKYKINYRFKDLKNDTSIKKEYADSLVYSRSYPYMFYCWFAYGSQVVFFKRPQYLTDDTIVSCVIVMTDSAKAAKSIVRNLSEKEMKRIFKKSNFVIL